MHAVCTCTSSYGLGTSLPTEYRQPSSRNWIGIGSLEEPFQPQCLRCDTIDAAHPSLPPVCMHLTCKPTGYVISSATHPSRQMMRVVGLRTRMDHWIGRHHRHLPYFRIDSARNPFNPSTRQGVRPRLTELDSGWYWGTAPVAWFPRRLFIRDRFCNRCRCPRIGLEPPRGHGSTRSDRSGEIQRACLEGDQIKEQRVSSWRGCRLGRFIPSCSSDKGEGV